MSKDSDALETEKARLEEQSRISESVINEYRQALADAQFALAKANAKLKLSNPPTA